MKTLRNYTLLLTLVALLFLPTTVLAGSILQDRVIFGENFTLLPDETLDGNLIVFGGNVSLEHGSTVTGDVVIFGGNLTAAGIIDGDLVGLGGLVHLQDGSITDGDVAVVGGTLDREVGAVVKGQLASELPGPLTFAFPGGVDMPRLSMQLSPMFDALWFTLSVFLWAGLAVLVVLFFPKQSEKVARTLTVQPLIAISLGILTMIVLPFALLVLIVTILGIPVAVVVMAAAALAWAFGFVALGKELGRRLAEALRQDWTPVLAAGLGTFLLMLVVNGIRSVVPCLGIFVPAFAGAFGLGAVLLTRFGTQDYPPRDSLSVPATPPRAVPPAQPSPTATDAAPEPPDDIPDPLHRPGEG